MSPSLQSPPSPIEAELASRLLARRRLIPFIKRINPKYLVGWVHKDICERLERFSRDVADGKNPRLMLLMPPRHGKSEIASRNFPAWHMGQYPDHEIIACSYNVSLAMGFSRKVKQIIEDPNYAQVFPGAQLDPKNQSTEEWALEGARGGYVAAGIGGPITGKGAHVLVIDDPVKNAEEADSADQREKVWEWYNSTAYTRLAPGGGVLVIQCMTGDTPVLLASGMEARLDSLYFGESIATYDRGRLSTSTVVAVKSNGRDSILEITTISGKMVRANGRHPFLVALNGELKWVRARSLTTAHKIVALRDSGASGKESLVRQMAATSLPSAKGSASTTTASRSGLLGTGRLASTLNRIVGRISSTAMALLSKITTGCSRISTAFAASVENLPALSSPAIGRASSQSTTATTQGRSEASCATTATQESDILELSPWHSPLPDTYDFTLDEIVSVRPAGEAEVFDLQVERTENFIANGVVSHNTWWHDDDLAGRLQTMMKNGSDDEHVDQFEVIRYPAIAESDEFYDPVTHEIVRLDSADETPHDYTLLRRKGEPLHEARYDLDKLLRIKAQNQGGRWWSALYQQNPVPDDGAYFLKEHFRRADIPRTERSNVFIAWDFAISEKKQSDYTVGTVGLQDDNDMLHVADQMRFKSADAFFIVESILNLCERWYSPTLVIGFEDGQIYRAIEALLKKRMRERRVYPSVMVLKPITDKMARARPLQGRMQQGMVSFNRVGEWYDVCRQEMLRFPAGAHDDCVDSLAWMASMAIGRQPPRKITYKEPESWRNKLKLDASAASHMGC
jgi:predicted phage terminase large subunit-like protein